MPRLFGVERVFNTRADVPRGDFANVVEEGASAILPM